MLSAIIFRKENALYIGLGLYYSKVASNREWKWAPAIICWAYLAKLLFKIAQSGKTYVMKGLEHVYMCLT